MLKAAAIYVAVRKFLAEHGSLSEGEFTELLEQVAQEWVTAMNFPEGTDDLRAQFATRMLTQLSQACIQVVQKIEKERSERNDPQHRSASFDKDFRW